MSRAEPADVAFDAGLRDGRTVRVRPVREDDLDALMALWDRLSPETIRLRFFAPRTMTRAQMRYAVTVDGRWQFAAVAEVADRLVGIARFDRLDEDPSTAEFAVLVEDAEQGRGVGSVLIRALLKAAPQCGVAALSGDVLEENEAMLQVLHRLGLAPTIRSYGNALSVRFATAPSDASRAAIARQERRAAVAALSWILAPDSVAVIAASCAAWEQGGPGDRVVAGLRDSGFAGPITVVADGVEEVRGIPTVGDLTAVAGVPDLALLAVSATELRARCLDAGRAGIPAVVALDIGEPFAPRDAYAVEEALAACRRFGTRLLGPGSLGVRSAVSGVVWSGTGIHGPVTGGSVGVCTSSPTLGRTLLAALADRGVGVRWAVDIGVGADLGMVEAIAYAAEDEGTSALLLCGDTLGDPQEVAAAARAVTQGLPIVAHVDASTVAPFAAAASEGALDVLLAQAGVLPVPSIAALAEAATLLSADDQQHDVCGTTAALAALATTDRTPARGRGDPVEVDITPGRVHAVLAAAAHAASRAGTDPCALDATTSLEVLAAAGIAVADPCVGEDADDLRALRVTLRSTTEVGPLLTVTEPGRHAAGAGSTTVGVAPLTDVDVDEMVEDVTQGPASEVDRDGALADLFVRLTALAGELTRLDSVTCDVVVCGPHDAVVVAAAVTLLPHDM